ncbi:hypothetical protein CPB86DRAFT_790823 [Serendipita vermifera]|nr:hypothetical protein CPB86DRAFT_790823 [Serendipita vermifera]
MKELLQDGSYRVQVTEKVKTPRLPNEIWLIILEFAIRPTMVTELEFEPYQIDQAYKCLSCRSHGDQRAAERMTFKAGNPLRAVCALWRDIIDQLEIDSPWVLDDPSYRPDIQSNQSSSTYGDTVINTENHIRMNRLIIPEEETLQIQMKYSHPLTTLALSVDDKGHLAARLGSVHDITSFPAELRVLSLYLDIHAIPYSFFKELQMSLTSLTTLRLWLYPGVITESLEFPTVITLCIGILKPRLLTSPIILSALQWTLPVLRNLSLTDHNRSADQNTRRRTGVTPFFLKLLQTHFDIIQSLRIEPTMNEIFDVASTICWLKLPRLNTLAADFDFTLIPAKHNQELKSNSVLHLIQTVKNIHSSEDGSRIRYFIRSCPQLETLSLPFRRSKNRNIYMSYGRITRIYGEACQEYNIKLLDEEGTALLVGEIRCDTFPLE